MTFKKVSRAFFNLLFLLSLFLVSFNIAWHISSFGNHFYKPLYSAIDIQAHIKKYSPQNHQKHFRAFEFTESEQHFRLFGEISDAINQGGEGLSEISFYTDNAEQGIHLLTPAEVIHLEDVAKLVKVFNWTAIVGALFVILCLWRLYQNKFTLFGYKATVLSFVFVALILSSAVLLIGPKNVFYELHKLIFSENQWFFYYQESLMTTLMKAPFIFGYISIGISVVAMVVFVILLALSRALLPQR